MKTSNLRKTRVDLPEATRAELVSLLNERLADTLDYAMQLKQAHWNVRGRRFVMLHEMFDEQAGQAQEYADLMAERAVMLGGQARGTVGVVHAGTTLPEYPVNATDDIEHLEALAERLEILAGTIRNAIDTATELRDPDTADLLTEVSRGLDKQLWYLEAHLSE